MSEVLKSALRGKSRQKIKKPISPSQATSGLRKKVASSATARARLRRKVSKAP